MFAYARGAAIAAIVLSAAAPAFAESAAKTAPVGHTVTSPRDPSSGQATGKRMHKPLLVHRDIAADATSTGSDGGAASATPADSSAAAKTAGAPLKGVDVKLGK